MSLELAAAYVGLSPNKFTAAVKAGRYPAPDVDGLFDRKALDKAFDDRLPNMEHYDPFRQRAEKVNDSSEFKVR